MNSMKRQQGQTLGGMILGILIAVVILGGAFWFFSQQKAPFQPEVVKQDAPAPKPEIIVPDDGLESILHKNPSEWLNKDEATDENNQPESVQKPVESVEGAKQPANKTTPDELGRFIEKDLAKKEDLEVTPTTPEVKAEPKPIETKTEPKPPVDKEKKPEPAKKTDAETKQPVEKKPVEQAKAVTKSGTLQAGAYRTPEQAEEQKVKLALMGYTANVIKSDLGEKGIMYRVRMSVSDAQGAKADLASKGVDVMVVR